MVNLRICAEGSLFSGPNFENGEPDSGFALLGVFYGQMIAIESILHIVYSKTQVFTVVFACATF